MSRVFLCVWAIVVFGDVAVGALARFLTEGLGFCCCAVGVLLVGSSIPCGLSPLCGSRFPGCWGFAGAAWYFQME